MKRIHIIATGGTIAGSSQTSTSSIYQAGSNHISDIVKSIPDIQQIANLSYEQLISIGSQNMTPKLWLKLLHRCNEVLQDQDIDGVVITHGTDTMEESAYFLNLTINSNKPVVLTGSMRNSSSISSDGALNLFNAISVAAYDGSADMGVMVVMNDQIHSAREVVKSHTNNVSTFVSPNTGVLGVVNYGSVKFYMKSLRLNTTRSEFINLINSNCNVLPRVDIAYLSAGSFLSLKQHEGAKGVIIAGLGDGNIPDDLVPIVNEISKNGIFVVICSSCFAGVVNAGEMQKTKNIIKSDNLTPRKARILLMCGIYLNMDLEQIKLLFELY